MAKAEQVEKVKEVVTAEKMVEQVAAGAEVAREESAVALAVAQWVAAYFRATVDAQGAHRCGPL